MRGDGGNHHEKLGLESILCASQSTIPDMAGRSPDPVYDNTDTRSSQPNEASCTSDFSYPLVSSTLFPSSSLISIILVHNSTIIAELKVRSFLCISPCHDHELTPSRAYTYISKMLIGPEATHKPPRHSGRPHRYSQIIPDAPRPPWS